MLGLFRVTLAPILLAVLAVTSTPPPQTVEMTPPSDRGHYFEVIHPHPMTPVISIEPALLTGVTDRLTVPTGGKVTVILRLSTPVPISFEMRGKGVTSLLPVDGIARLEHRTSRGWLAVGQAPVTGGVGSLTWEPPSSGDYRLAFGATFTGVAYSSPFTITVLPPPPPKRYVPRDYGPVPALTGPILLTGGKYVGVPYVHGGESPSGFDCSGFVQYVYAENGIAIPRTTDGIRDAGTVIPAAQAQPGDIMYWSGHVALYVAPGWRLDANRPGSTVQIRPSYGNPIYLTF